MIRNLVAALSVLLLTTVSVQARDDGGFGSGFTNAAPSALSDTSPSSALAQKTTVTGEPNAQDLENIMPAAGDEEIQPPAGQPAAAQTPCGDAIIVAPENPAQ